MLNTQTFFGLVGSLAKKSVNHQVMEKLKSFARGLEIYPSLADLPHFNPDFTEGETPAVVKAYRKKISQADAVIICSPEYAHGIPGTLKNALDWVVASGEFSKKPTLIICTSSSGGEYVEKHLAEVIKTMDAKLVVGPRFISAVVRKDLDGTVATTLKEVLDLLN